MKLPNIMRVALAGVLVGCGQQFASNPASPSMNGANSAAHTIAAEQKYFGPSWMQPGKKAGALLYVSDSLASTVSVYTYPGKELVGTLTGLNSPQGECVDKVGNIYITDTGKEQILEYARGGTTPIATISDPNYQPVSCAIDPSTGDLAVANILYQREGLSGNVVVYKQHGRNIRYFSLGNIYSYYFVAYDPNGNLFVDGLTEQAPFGTFQFAELPHRSGTMRLIALSGGTIAFPGDVQWDGTHITVGDQKNAVIYQTAGSKIVGSTPLTGSSDIVGYVIDAGTVIGADGGNGSVEFYPYPAGGKSTGQITGFEEPSGAVVSP